MNREEEIKQIASIAWKGAANAFRMYPDNKHTFADYWDAAKDQFKEFESAPPQSGVDVDYVLVVKKIKVTKLLDSMLSKNKALYEQLLDSNISFEFNQICNLAGIPNQSTSDYARTQSEAFYEWVDFHWEKEYFAPSGIVWTNGDLLIGSISELYDLFTKS